MTHAKWSSSGKKSELLNYETSEYYVLLLQIEILYNKAGDGPELHSDHYEEKISAP